jgi:CubicO group peptidase (beta-lactamase class C family)
VSALVCLLGLSTTGSAQTPPAPVAAAARLAAPAPAPAATPTASYVAPGVTPLPPAELEAFVDGVIRDAMGADHIPGVTISIVQNGQTVLKKGYGFSRLEPTPRAVDPDRTLFRVASISKTFTWIAVMREVEAGRMRLDAPINLYLPEQVQVRDQGFVTPVRVRDLMSHTPGFEDRALGQLFERDPARVRPQLVYLRQERPRREFEPGTTPAYSNYGVNLAGAALSYVGQRPFERIIEQDITGPLGMARTTFRDPYPARPDLPAPMPAALAADVADGFFWTGAGWRKRPYEFTSHGAPAGGASTTAGDMARYMTMILNGGSLDGATIYGPVTARGFRTVQWRPNPSIAGTANGFLPFTLPGNRTGWGHDGVLLSFRSSMIVVPELGLGVFISANSESGERLTGQLTGRIVQRFYGPAPTLPEPGSAWLKANASAFTGQYVANRRSFHGLEKFIGLINNRVSVQVSDSGVLLISGFGFNSRWIPTGTSGVFRQADGWRTIAFEMKDGRAVRYYTGGGVNSYERVGMFGGQGWLTNLGLLTLIASAATLAGVVLRVRSRDYRETPMQRRSSLVQTSQAALWILAAFTAGIWLSKTGDVAAIFFDWPGGLMLTASSCALVATVLSAVNVALLPFIWRGGRRVDSWTMGRKLRFTATALIFGAFSLVLAFWGAIYPWAS